MWNGGCLVIPECRWLVLEDSYDTQQIVKGERNKNIFFCFQNVVLQNILYFPKSYQAK